MEDHETRIKRLIMRSNYRGIKEMDIIMGGFARSELAGLSAAELDTYEVLMAENDHDLYAWVTGAADVPDEFAGLMARMTDHAKKLPETKI